MAMTTEMPSPAYVIYRDSLDAQSFDPAALQFFPPKESDELFFALKTAYPLVSTHSERMRNAVIDFLVNERDAQQTQPPTRPSLDSSLSYESDAAKSWQHSGSSSSYLSSPDVPTLSTPASTASPASRAIPLSRTTSLSHTTASPQPIDQMTSVFSLSSQSQPKTKTRRKMTEAEKIEYRRRRLIKACEKCSKRKRKCHHSQIEMIDTAATRKSSKQSPPGSTSKSRGKQAERMPAVSEVQPPSQSEDPFAFLLSDPLPEPSEYDMLAPFSTLQTMDDPLDFSTIPFHHTSTFPWTDDQDLDWTLLDFAPSPMRHSSTPASRFARGAGDGGDGGDGGNGAGAVILNSPRRKLDYSYHLGVAGSISPAALSPLRSPDEHASSHGLEGALDYPLLDAGRSERRATSTTINNLGGLGGGLGLDLAAGTRALITNKGLGGLGEGLRITGGTQVPILQTPSLGLSGRLHQAIQNNREWDLTGGIGGPSETALAGSRRPLKRRIPKALHSIIGADLSNDAHNTVAAGAPIDSLRLSLANISTTRATQPLAGLSEPIEEYHSRAVRSQKHSRLRNAMSLPGNETLASLLQRARLQLRHGLRTSLEPGTRTDAKAVGQNTPHTTPLVSTPCATQPSGSALVESKTFVSPQGSSKAETTTLRLSNATRSIPAAELVRSLLLFASQLQAAATQAINAVADGQSAQNVGLLTADGQRNLAGLA